MIQKEFSNSNSVFLDLNLDSLKECVDLIISFIIPVLTSILRFLLCLWHISSGWIGILQELEVLNISVVITVCPNNASNFIVTHDEAEVGENLSKLFW